MLRSHGIRVTQRCCGPTRTILLRLRPSRHKLIPKLSIAIPSRTFSQQLQIAIKSALHFTEGAEVVVSLNDENRTSEAGHEWLADLMASSPRFRVVRPARMLSMTENFRFVFGNLRGEWQTIHGADDGILPSLEPLVTFADNHSTGPTICLFPRAHYFWPGVEHKYGKAHIFLTSRPAYRIRSNLAQCIMGVMAGHASYLHLPQLYAGGAIRRDAVARIGIEKLFSSYSPDVSAAVAIALSQECAIEYEIPGFWAGTSPLSNGLAVSEVVSGRQLNDAVDVNYRMRSDEFFRLSESDGHGLSDGLSDIPQAKYVVAASAFSSAEKTELLRPKQRDIMCGLVRAAVRVETRGSRRPVSSCLQKGCTYRPDVSRRINCHHLTVTAVSIVERGRCAARKVFRAVVSILRRVANHTTTSRIVRSQDSYLSMIEASRFVAAQFLLGHVERLTSVR